MRQFLVLAAALSLLLSFGCDRASDPPTAAVLDSDSSESETADQSSMSAKATTNSVVHLRIADSGNRAVSSGIDTVLVYRDFAFGDTFLVAGTADMPDKDGVMAVGLAWYPGDFNGDGRVYFDDFFLFADIGIGALTPGIPIEDWPFDLDRNGAVDFDDFFLFAEWFGAGLSAGKVVVSADEKNKIHQHISALNSQSLVLGELLWEYYIGEISLADIAKNLRVSCEPTARPKIAFVDIPLRFIILNSAVHAPRDTTITKDWPALAQASRSGSDDNNLIRIWVRTVPRVNTRARTQIDGGAGFVGRFTLSEFFEPESDGSRMTFRISPSVSGVSIQDSMLVVSFKDSTAANFQVVLTATNSAGLSASHSFAIHRAAVTTKLSVVLPDTLRVGDEVIPRAKREVYWDGTYRSTDSTNASIIAVVDPARLERTGLTTISISYGGQTYTKEVLVRPLKEDDFLKILGVNARPLERKIAVRVVSGVDSVTVSLNLNGSTMPMRTVSVSGDSATAEFSVLFPENQKVNIFTEATDRFGNRDTLSTIVQVRDLTAPVVRIDSVRVTKDRIIWSIVVDDEGGFSGNWNNPNPFTITAIDTLRKEEVFSLKSGLVSQGSNRYVSWTGNDGVDFPTTTTSRVLRVILRVQDDAGNIATKELLLTQPASSTATPPPRTQPPAQYPNIVVSASSLDFGTVQAKQSSTQSFTVANNGDAQLTVHGISSTNSVFSTDNAEGFSLSPGQSTNVTVMFSPQIAGNYSGQIVITSNDPDGSMFVNVSGVATPIPVPKLNLSDSTVNITAQIGKTQTAQFSASNSGGANLELSSITIPGGGSVLTVAPNAAVIGPGAQRTITVTFAPSAAETISSLKVIILSNDPNRQEVQIPITAIGTAIPVGIMAVAPTQLQFGSTLINNPVSATVSVTNVGDGVLTVSGITYTDPVFSAQPQSFALSPGNTQTVAFQFNPAEAKAYTASASIKDANDGSAVVDLFGTGTNPEQPPAQYPNIVVSASSLGFGTVQVQQSNTRNFTVTNNGQATLAVNGISSTNSVFSTDNAGGFSLVPGQSANVTGMFSPQIAGNYFGQFIITSNDPDGSVVVNVSGVATPIPAPNASVSPSALSFTTQINTTASGKAVVSNTGDAVLSVSSISITGAGLSVAPNQATTINPGQQLQLTVTYAAPSVAGVVKGDLVILSNDADEPNITIPITATATEVSQVFLPDIVVNPESLNFGSLDIGLSATRTIQVSNQGNANLENIAASLISGTSFSVSTPSSTVTPLDSVTVVVGFTPILAGSASDTLRITSNDTSTPQVDIPLSGIGTTPAPDPEPDISVNQTALLFGNLAVGSSSVQSLVVVNNGNASANVKISPQTSDGFSISSADTSFTLSAGSSRSVGITFAPSAPVTSSGVFNIHSDDPDTPDITVNATGTGLAPILNLLTTSIDFGDVEQTTTGARWLKVANTIGNLPLNVSFATGGVFSLSGVSLFIAPGATDSVQVIFAPTAVQSYNGTVSMQSNGNSGIIQVPVSGNGIEAPKVNIGNITINGETKTSSNGSVQFDISVGASINISVEAENYSEIIWKRVYTNASLEQRTEGIGGSSNSISISEPFKDAIGGVTIKLEVKGLPGDIKYLDIFLKPKAAP